MVAHLPTAKECVEKAASAAKPDALIRFLNSLWSTNVGENLFDPWRQANCDDLDEGSIAQRRFALAAHLSAPCPSLLCVGEAPGYRGCRVSGVPFTSERQIFNGEIPRLTSMKKMRFSECETPWLEPSATHVWHALEDYKLRETTILWNAVPWHPHPPGQSKKNRSPTAAEQRDDRVFSLLRLLRKALPEDIKVVAIGRVAERALKRINADPRYVCHPAARGGGAKRFQDGIREVASVIVAARIR